MSRLNTVIRRSIFNKLHQLKMKNRLFHNNRFLSSNFKSDTTVPNTETPSSFNDIQDSEPPVLFPWKTMTELPEPTSIFSYITSILKKELNHVLLTSMRLRFIDSWDYHALRIYWSRFTGMDWSCVTTDGQILSGQW